METYKNSELDFTKRAEDLVSKMTVEEKASQLVYNAPAIERLGIPAYNWWNEALHGVARAGTATVFPQAIGLGAMFDDEFVEIIADVISTEGRAKYNEAQRMGDFDTYKGLTFWSPNINIFRDPRWGRAHETYGEDPYLTAENGKAFVRGIQGKDPKYLKAAACAKHFAVHSGAESQRHSFNAVVDNKTLQETYLYAFEELVCNANVESIMGAYNRVNGEPCCGSKILLKDILRDKWQFKGHVVSDCSALKDFHINHMVTKTAPESVALALKNGCDLNCGNLYLQILIALKEGLVSGEDIDRAVIRLMTTRLKLGMLDKTPYDKIPYELNDCKLHSEINYEAAKKSLVLLKNTILPLKMSDIKNIGVIGPNADSIEVLKGNYSGTASKYVTILDGIHELAKDDMRVYYAQGCHLYKDKVEGNANPEDRIKEAVSVAKRSDVVVLCLGLDASIEGEEGDASNEYGSGDKPNLNLPGLQQKLLESVIETGTPVVLVVTSGSALALNYAKDKAAAIIYAWYPGSLGGRAVASMIFGEFSPVGRLPVTFYKTTEELPDFCDYSMQNRTYRYINNEPLYPFGYGLSYTTFRYNNIELLKEIKKGQDQVVSVEVENVGNFDSDEVVQLYIKDVEASVKVPKCSLCGFKRVFITAGDKKIVEFTISSKSMSIVNENGDRLIEHGEFIIYAGGSSPVSDNKNVIETKFCIII